MAWNAWNVIFGSSVGLVGIIGLVLILAAWVPGTLTTIKTKKVGMRIEFIFLYLFGSLFLALHSIILNDLIFLTLNGLATVMAFINLYYYLIYEKHADKKKGKKKVKK